MDSSKFTEEKGLSDIPFSDGDSMAEDSLLEQVSLGEQKHPTTPRTRFLRAAIFHATILVFYTLVLIAIIRSMAEEKLHGPGVIYTPARDALVFEPLVFDVKPDIESVYVGEPRPELDLAWHDLLQYQNIRVSSDEMRKMGHLDEGVKLPVGGYFASLMVYHQLHCIKRLHQFTYSDHYFPNISDYEMRHNRLHNSHCLDILRQAIQCQGDASLLTMRWGKNQAVPIGNFQAPHECVNWDHLNNWAAKRSVDMFAPGVLVHPTLGPSFPNGEAENHIGVAVEDS